MLCVPSVEASLPPMLPVRSSTGTIMHSVVVDEVPIGLASGSFPTTRYRISFSPRTLIPRWPSSLNSWGFAPSSPRTVQGGQHSPLASSLASSYSQKTSKGDKIDRSSAWGYWDRFTVIPTRSESPFSRKTDEMERGRKSSNSLFTR